MYETYTFPLLCTCRCPVVSVGSAGVDSVDGSVVDDDPGARTAICENVPCDVTSVERRSEELSLLERLERTLQGKLESYYGLLIFYAIDAVFLQKSFICLIDNSKMAQMVNVE